MLFCGIRQHLCFHHLIVSVPFSQRPCATERRSIQTTEFHMFVFEDSEAGINVIIAGRSPNMRFFFFSRPHSVDSDVSIYSEFGSDSLFSVCEHQGANGGHSDQRIIHRIAMERLHSIRQRKTSTAH